MDSDKSRHGGNKDIMIPTTVTARQGTQHDAATAWPLNSPQRVEGAGVSRSGGILVADSV